VKKSLLKILHHFAQRGLVQTITGKDVMRYRPAFHHHHPVQNLAMTGFAQVQLLEADLHPPPRFPLRLPAAPGPVAA
jgi:hypothetical protein